MVRILVSAMQVHSSSVFHAARRQQDTERGFATAYLPPSRHADAYFGLLADLVVSDLSSWRASEGDGPADPLTATG